MNLSGKVVMAAIDNPPPNYDDPISVVDSILVGDKSNIGLDAENASHIQT